MTVKLTFDNYKQPLMFDPTEKALYDLAYNHWQEVDPFAPTMSDEQYRSWLEGNIPGVTNVDLIVTNRTLFYAKALTFESEEFYLSFVLAYM